MADVVSCSRTKAKYMPGVAFPGIGCCYVTTLRGKVCEVCGNPQPPKPEKLPRETLEPWEINDICETVFGNSLDMLDLRLFDFARAVELRLQRPAKPPHHTKDS